MSGPDRRDRRPFEPPPWEREAFESFERTRAARQPAPAAEPVSAPPVTVPPAPRSPEGARVAQPAQPAATPVLAEEQVEAMLVDLRVEEPPAGREYVGFANAVSALMALGGLALVIWAGVALGKTGPEGGWLAAMTSVLMMVWGFMMIGGGALLWRKYNLRS